MEAPSWGSWNQPAFVKNCFIYPKHKEPKAIDCVAAMSNPSYPKHMFKKGSAKDKASGFLEGKPGKWMVTGTDSLEKVVEEWEAYNPGYVLEVQLHSSTAYICSCFMLSKHG